MQRKIIKINEDKCTGCGECIPDCPEGALQIINGKARLISDLFCDGLGACIKACPFNAMTIEEREAESYNEYKVMENIVKAGEEVIKAHLKHLKDHNEEILLKQALDYLKENNYEIPKLEGKKACSCLGNMQKNLAIVESTLNNWPIQLSLLNVNAPYLVNAELLIVADCVSFAYKNFHEKFLKNKVLIIFCPKLDDNSSVYIEKLTNIFKNQNIKSITTIRMEVPCCTGVEIIVKEALEKAEKQINLENYIISLKGDII